VLASVHCVAPRPVSAAVGVGSVGRGLLAFLCTKDLRHFHGHTRTLAGHSNSIQTTQELQRNAERDFGGCWGILTRVPDVVAESEPMSSLNCPQSIGRCSPETNAF
jgi:hypothetical protein